MLVTLLGEDNTNAAALILYARCLAGSAVNWAKRKRARRRQERNDHRPHWPAPGASHSAPGRRPPDAANSPGATRRMTRRCTNWRATAARQQYDAALDGLLKLFIRNRSYSEGLQDAVAGVRTARQRSSLVTVYRLAVRRAVLSLTRSNCTAYPAAELLPGPLALWRRRTSRRARRGAAGQAFQPLIQKQFQAVELPGLCAVNPGRPAAGSRQVTAAGVTTGSALGFLLACNCAPSRANRRHPAPGSSPPAESPTVPRILNIALTPALSAGMPHASCATPNGRSNSSRKIVIRSPQLAHLCPGAPLYAVAARFAVPCCHWPSFELPTRRP